MKAIIKSLLVLAIAAGMTSCAYTYPGMATANPVGNKVGEASAKYILGFIHFGKADMGIATAAKNGGITKVATVDYRIKGGLFSTTYTTIVSGE